MLVYATREQFAEHVTELPDNTDTLLKYASVMVRKATRFALYDVTPAGMPTDPWVIDAMADATCVQAAEWVAAGIDPSAGGAGSATPVSKSSIDGASVEYDTTARQAAVERATTTLCPAAADVLAAEGLAARTVATW